MSNQHDPKDQRNESRQRTTKRGLVEVGDGRDPIDCKIVNWSANGARLHFDELFNLETRFRLRVFFGVLEVANTTCKVCWRKNKDVGVQFETPLPFDVNF